MHPNHELSISLPRVLQYRDAVGALIVHICRELERAGEDPNFAYQIISAFNEAFNNVTKHARPSDGKVEVRLRLNAHELILEILDDGPPFDYQNVEMPRLEDLPESGLGIFIMRSFMHEVNYLPGGPGTKNTLRMIRRLKAGTPIQDPAHQGTVDDA